MTASARSVGFTVATVAAVVVAALIVAVGVAVVVDFRHATGPDHVNDDGSGWITVLGALALIVLVPLWALLVWIAIACRRRSGGRAQPRSGLRVRSDR